MISIGANRNRKAYGIKHYNLDTEAELQEINTSREVMGTTAFVIENSKYYMVNGSKQWKEIQPYGTGSGGSGGGDEPGSGKDIVYDGGGV